MIRRRTGTRWPGGFARDAAAVMVLSCLSGAAYGWPVSERGVLHWFLRPFIRASVWNMPLPEKAGYGKVPGIEAMYGGINYEDRWGVGFYRASRGDRKARIYIHDWTLWGKLDTGEVKTTGNPPALEEKLRKESKDFPDFPANYYSTTTRATDAAGRTWPKDILPVALGWSAIIYVPKEARPSPDTDALLAIFQPDGRVLECYNAVVCANGDVVCSMASFSDPMGDGSGWNNGRCASMISCYAGLLRKDEVASGRIRHALQLTCSRKLLAPRAVFPALAFDMNDRYEGTLPMGSRLALPRKVDVSSLGLGRKGEVMARAFQEYGGIIVDRGGDGGITVRAELEANDALYPERATDMTIIVRKLRRVE